MATDNTRDAKAKLGILRNRLVNWLTDAAYPMWATNGIDPLNGGFIETIGQNGAGLAHPRRARVHPRQIYSFAQAPVLGWGGDARRVLRRGMEYFSKYYRRSDGLFRTLAAVDGASLDDKAVLYDQAFALLGYSVAGVGLEARDEFEQRALELRTAIDATFRDGSGAFRSHEAGDGPIESNPHMHLLEACLAWTEVGTDSGWREWAHQLLDLAMRHFIRADSGALGEFFTADLKPAPGTPGRIIEPGHQFEWAWLLLRSEALHSGPLRQAALKLMDIGENAGVHNQVAINALLDDFSVHDPNARFWPQTERLKAALFAAQASGEEKYWVIAAAAAASFLPYLKTPVAGLWLDVQLPSGELVDSPAPASTFYHLVGAIVALDNTLAAVNHPT